MAHSETITIVTDSSAGLPTSVARAYGITVAPIYIQVGGQSFRENVDISTEEFYRMLDGKTIPVTSSPPPGEFAKVYRSLAKCATHILSIHITAKASATCQAARLAAESISGATVRVYDSQTLSMGTGFLAIEAAKAAREGLGIQEIIARLNQLRDRIVAYGAIPTLEYLRRSGRVTHGQALLASLLSIKPVLEIKDGEVRVVDRVRSYQRALERMLELASSRVGQLPARVAVMHANCLEGAKKFAEAVVKKINVEDLFIGEVGATLAAHGGPGLIGIALYPVL
ncbi:MAG TPA: DegV family protein [Firmicutes bacterium]|nr:DegV family protein [Bacillota bacterium]